MVEGLTSIQQPTQGQLEGSRKIATRVVAGGPPARTAGSKSKLVALGAHLARRPITSSHAQRILVTLAERPYPFPSRTRKSSSPAPKILRGQPLGKIGRRQDLFASWRAFRQSRPARCDDMVRASTAGYHRDRDAGDPSAPRRLLPSARQRPAGRDGGTGRRRPGPPHPLLGRGPCGQLGDLEMGRRGAVRDARPVRCPPAVLCGVGRRHHHIAVDDTRARGRRIARAGPRCGGNVRRDRVLPGGGYAVPRHPCADARREPDVAPGPSRGQRTAAHVRDAAMGAVRDQGRIPRDHARGGRAMCRGRGRPRVDDADQRRARFPPHPLRADPPGPSADARRHGGSLPGDRWSRGPAESRQALCRARDRPPRRRGAALAGRGRAAEEHDHQLHDRRAFMEPATGRPARGSDGPHVRGHAWRDADGAAVGDRRLGRARSSGSLRRGGSPDRARQDRSHHGP